MPRKKNEDIPDSILNSYTLLKKYCQEECEVSRLLLISLTSQQAFAALTISEDKIISMSLNTMKMTSELCIDGGWYELNSMRLRALKKYKKEEPKKKSSRSIASLERKNKVTERELEEARKENLLLLQIIGEILDDVQILEEKVSHSKRNEFSQELKQKVQKVLTLNSKRN